MIFEALYVIFTFYVAYTLIGFPMAWVLKRTGYRNGMLVGLVIMVIGALLFIPAAYSVNYIYFLDALFIFGAGLKILSSGV